MLYNTCVKSLPLSFPCGSAGKESACNAGDLCSIPGLGRSPGEGKGYPHQYSGLENSMDCIVHRVRKSQAQLRDFHFNFKSFQCCLTLWSRPLLPSPSPLPALRPCAPTPTPGLLGLGALRTHRPGPLPTGGRGGHRPSWGDSGDRPPGSASAPLSPALALGGVAAPGSARGLSGSAQLSVPWDPGGVT